MSRIAWITGASSGIGKWLALGLARQSWRVAISSRSHERLASVCRTEETVGERLVAYPVDVTHAKAMRGIAQTIEQDLGPIDLCILNAGDYEPMPLASFDTGLFRRLMEVNYMGVVHGLAAVLPSMMERGTGAIMITASVAGYRGLPLAAPYGASKAALINLAESLQPELGARGITMRVINPGFVKTPLTDKNPFKMPAIIEPKQAADAILRALGRSSFEITFPKRFTYMLKFLRCLPYRFYFPLIKRVTE